MKAKRNETVYTLVILVVWQVLQYEKGNISNNKLFSKRVCP